MKLTKGHGEYGACERYTVRGRRVKRQDVHPDLDCVEKNNKSLRSVHDRNHHNGEPALLTIELHVNTVTSFVLGFMRLCCVDVMKRILVQNCLSTRQTCELSKPAK